MGKLNNIIVCLVGKSGCGKSTIAKALSDNCGYDILQSYTTRNDYIDDRIAETEVLKDEVAKQING